jgi:soluble lytic murein transglycosylase-like protein
MQLLPTTLRGEAVRSGLEGNDPYDPVLNVRAGVRYYRRLLDAFRNPDLALMAYNAGPARIGGYLRQGQVPERFHGYPRHVRAEVLRLRKSIGGEPRATMVQRGALPGVR